MGVLVEQEEKVVNTTIGLLEGRGAPSY